MTGAPIKPVLITGGGKRLGAAMAKAVHAHGWTPIIHYNTSADAAVALASSLGGHAIGADLSDPDAVAGLVPRAQELIGQPLCALINNASQFEHDRPETVTAAALAAHFQVNTLAPALLAKAFFDQAPAGPGDDPVIVNIIDQKLWNLHPDFFSYTISKAALETATQLMARSFAPGVRVCGVAPGYALPAPGQDEADFARKAATTNALERRLAPELIAHTVRFCLENSALTGQTIIAANGEQLVPTDRDISLK